jgi:hypothetical protein
VSEQDDRWVVGEPAAGIELASVFTLTVDDRDVAVVGGVALGATRVEARSDDGVSVADVLQLGAFILVWPGGLEGIRLTAYTGERAIADRLLGEFRS